VIPVAAVAGRGILPRGSARASRAIASPARTDGALAIADFSLLRAKATQWARAGRCAPGQRKFNRNDETRVFKDWRDGQDAPVRWRAARFSARLRAAGQLLELKLLFSKKRRVVLISGAHLVFHLVARVVRQA